MLYCTVRASRDGSRVEVDNNIVNVIVARGSSMGLSLFLFYFYFTTG